MLSAMNSLSRPEKKKALKKFIKLNYHVRVQSSQNYANYTLDWSETGLAYQNT